MKSYFECWTEAAKALFSQTLAGEPELVESQPQPLTAGAFGLAATLAGDVEGRFSVFLDSAILESPLLGEGIDQKAGWGELLREVTNAAAGELLAKTGKKCAVKNFEKLAAESKATHAFQLKFGERVFAVQINDEVCVPQPAVQPDSQSAHAPETDSTANISPGIRLLMDVELEVSLRFGCKELPLGEILDLGPGDVVQLDRNVSDPVDLIVGDKIVACGEVVLVNGNFGLRVTEVASPKQRLESIRCLF